MLLVKLWRVPNSHFSMSEQRGQKVQLDCFTRCTSSTYLHLLYCYSVKAAMATRVTLLTLQKIKYIKFQTRKPPIHLHHLNTFLLWVGQALLFFFDCVPTTFYPTEEGTSSTRIQSSWSSLKICVYLQASLQKCSEVVKHQNPNNETSEYKAFSFFFFCFSTFSFLFCCLNFALPIKRSLII